MATIPFPSVSQLYAPRGALFFTQGTSWLSRAIRWVERDKDEAKSWTNHVGLVTFEGYITIPPDGIGATVSEALWHIKEHSWWQAHGGEITSIAVFAPRGVSHAQISRIIGNARTRTGNRYAWWRLPGYLIERFTKIKVSKAFFLKDRNVCSNHAALALEAAGIRFPEPAGQLDPDEMMDYCLAHPDEWDFIGWSEVGHEG